MDELLSRLVSWPLLALAVGVAAVTQAVRVGVERYKPGAFGKGRIGGLILPMLPLALGGLGGLLPEVCTDCASVAVRVIVGIAVGAFSSSVYQLVGRGVALRTKGARPDDSDPTATAPVTP